MSTNLQTVTLITIVNRVASEERAPITMEATSAQAHLIENTEEGKLLLAFGTVLITKAIKQGNQYFALNPLQVTVPKESSGVSQRPLSIT